MIVTLLLLAFIFIIGITLVLLSKKLKFNPFIGFRVGYSMVSEEAWKRLNKVSGYTLSILSLVLTPLIFLEETIAIAIIALSVTVVTFLLIEYAERLAENVLLKEETEKTARFVKLEPVTPPLIIIALIMVSILITVYYLGTAYPLLPDRMAVHFNQKGVPNMYENKEIFYTVIAVILSMVYLLTLGFIWLGYKKPMVFHRPWFTQPVLIKFTKLLQLILTLITLIISYGVIDTIYYNLKNVLLPYILETILLGVTGISFITIYMTYITVKCYMK